MEGRGIYLRVGLLLIGALAAGIGLVLFLSAQRNAAGTMFETYFTESVQGLDVGGAVKYRGVTLGQVTQIGIVRAEYPQAARINPLSRLAGMVIVRFRIDLTRIGPHADPEAAIKAGLRIRLASQGITGITYLELDFVNPPDLYPPLHLTWTPSTQYIPSMPSTLTQVQDAATELLARLGQINLNGLMESIGGLVDQLRVEIATGDVHRLLVDTDATLHTVRDAIAGADLPALAGELRGAAGAIRGVAEGRPTQEMLSRAALAADRLAAAAEKLPALVTAVDGTVRRVDSGVADIQRDVVPLLRDARDAAQNLRETTEALRRYPAGSLLGGPPPRPAEAGR